MAKGAPRGGAKRGATASCAQAQNDADEAMADARAEIADTAAVLDAGESAGESSGAPAREIPSAIPSAVLQRRLDKAKSVTESAIKEKEALQKKLDEMRAELELAKSNVGDVLVAHNPVATPSGNKVCFVPLETG